MKKNYQKPLAEIIEVVPDDAIMNGNMGGLPGIGGEGGGSIGGGFEWDDDE